MSEYFGPITPFLIVGIVTALTQFTKQWTGFDGWKAALIALAWSFVLIAPYHLLVAEKLTPLVFYEAVLYTILGALTSAGLYSVTRTLFGERAQREQDDGFPK